MLIKSASGFGGIEVYNKEICLSKNASLFVYVNVVYTQICVFTASIWPVWHLHYLHVHKTTLLQPGHGRHSGPYLALSHLNSLSTRLVRPFPVTSFSPSAESELTTTVLRSTKKMANWYGNRATATMPLFARPDSLASLYSPTSVA